MISIKSRLTTTAVFLALLLVAAVLQPLTADAAVIITEYGGLTTSSGPHGITSGPDGALWFTEGAGNRIGRIDPTTHAVTEYELTPSSDPRIITSGPDGALWFTEYSGNRIGRIDPTTHAVTEYGGLTAGSLPYGITSGPDGALWFTEYLGDRIGRIDPTTHAVTEYGGLTAGSGPFGITSGPDGALWFTEITGYRIGRITTGGAVTEYGGLTADSEPHGITSGPDGALWFTEEAGNRIGRIDPTTHAVTEYGGLTAGSRRPTGITSGPDGALWFTEYTGDSIGRIDPTTHAVTEYVGFTAGSRPWAITSGPDGALWFTEYLGNQIGRVSIPFTVKASVSGSHGRVSPATQTVNSAGTATINVTPDAGYRTASIIDNGVNMSVTNPYVIGKMAADHNVVVTFKRSNSTWYLAEGTTSWGFSTYITIENPNADTVTANVTYMPTGKATVKQTVKLPGLTQTTLTNNDLIEVMGGQCDFSTKVTCKEGTTIAVDRTMSWTGPGAASPEAHNSIGVTAPAKTWYLPEGSSAWGFETWLLIQNPNSKEAACTITYMIEGTGPQEVTKTVPPNSRATFDMSKDIGARGASIKVESSVPVIPERAMYRNNRREGHDSIGTTSPAKDYYLAEGATGYDVGYITYVLVQNPQGSPTDITITYMTGSGEVAGPSFQMPANSRKTIRVNDQLGLNTDVSTRAHGSQPIIAERAMYWNNGTGEACHDSIGMSAPQRTFYLPDGWAFGGRETWTLVQNPNNVDVSVEISYLSPYHEIIPGPAPKPPGNRVFTAIVPANSRRTFNMADEVKEDPIFPYEDHYKYAIVVESKTPGRKIMCERAMYWNSRGAGTDTIGGYGD